MQRLSWMMLWLGLLLAPVLAQTGTRPVQTGTPNEERAPRAPALSADAQWIVYVAEVTVGGELLPSRRELWIVGRDGANERRLTAGPQDAEPRFSPDGRHIVFTRDKDIWQIGTDGSGLQNLTNTKDARESGAEYSNDGQSLIFLRDTNRAASEEEAKAAQKDVFALWGLSSSVRAVVQRDLKTGAERVLLRDVESRFGVESYGVEQVVANPVLDNDFFMICKPLNNEGKPQGGLNLDSIIAVLKTDGSAPRPVFAPEPEAKLRLRRLRIAQRNRTLLEVSRPDKIGTEVGWLEDGRYTPLPDVVSFGDVSRDGSVLVAPGIADDLSIRLMAHDLLTGEKRLVTRKPGEVPAEATAHFKQGRSLFDERRYAEAIAEFAQAIILHPTYAEAFRYRGWAHELNGDRTAALRDLDEAIRLDPKAVFSYLTRAHILLKAERNGEAMDDFTAAIVADPQYAQSYFERGELHRKRQEMAEALADFDAAIKLEPGSLSFLMRRGDLLAETGDRPAALADYLAAIAAYPNFAATYEKRARLYRALGQPELAAADEKRVEELKGNP